MMDVNRNLPGISTQTQQALRRSGPEQSITAGDIRALDGDNNGEISENEAGTAGIDQQDRESLNQALTQSAGHEASEVVFPAVRRADADPATTTTTSPTSTTATTASSTTSKPSYSQVWRQDRDAANDPATVTNADQLKTRLGISDWTSAPQVKTLVDQLQARGLATPQNLTHLARIAERHGSAALGRISADLSSYLNSRAVTGVSQNEVVSGALADIGTPSDIAQGSRYICGPTAVQTNLAIARPETYIDMLTTLARNQNYTTPGGQTVVPNNTWQGDTTDDRTLTGRIMGNAITNLARGNTTYDSSNDDKKGTSIVGENNALQSLYGNSVEFDNDTGNANDLYQYVEDDIARGRPVNVSFQNHSVTVVGIDKTQTPHRVIMDSWGAQYSMTADEFRARILSARSLDDSGYDNRQTRAGTRIMVGDR